MNKEHTEYLYNTYPILYGDRTKPMNQTAMCWGFDCGDGWFDIIDELSRKITARCEHENYGDAVRASQVKEKYGTLHFYMTCADDEIYEYIREAEEKSSQTCEVCGEPATTNTEGWYTTICDKCKET